MALMDLADPCILELVAFTEEMYYVEESIVINTRLIGRMQMLKILTI